MCQSVNGVVQSQELNKVFRLFMSQQSCLPQSVMTLIFSALFPLHLSLYVYMCPFLLISYFFHLFTFAFIVVLIFFLNFYLN